MSYASYLDTRCIHVTANGRRCSSSRISELNTLCVYHQQQLLERQRADGNAVQLLVPIEKFDSGDDIKFALGKVFQALARNAIPARNAAILAYICQLFLNTLPAREQHDVNAALVPDLKRILVRILKQPIIEAATQCAAPPPNSYWEDPIRFEAGELRLPEKKSPGKKPNGQ